MVGTTAMLRACSYSLMFRWYGRELRDVLRSEDVKRLGLQVSLKRWVPVETAVEGNNDKG